MLTFTFVPLNGIGPILFGMTRSEVRDILAELGQPRPALRSPNKDCFFKNAFQVSYDNSGRVEFIETASSNDYQVLFFGSVLHAIPAEDALRLISPWAEYNKNHPELGNSYIFPTLQLSLWRPFQPNDINDTEGRYFEAVGAGKEGYFSS